jgi:glycosyltransferase involved in cell wall biosynthesis
MTRLLVITPARDEADHIDRVADAMASQTRPPEAWVVVDDGSTDGTLDRLRRLEAELPFLKVLEAPQSAGEDGDRLAAAAEVRAFNWAFAQVGGDTYDLVAKLDADIVLHPEHWERLASELRDDRRLGIVGSYLLEEHGGGWVENTMPEYHVNGAVKLYRSRCLHAIGGIEQRLAWDTIDQTRARMLGWGTRSFRGIESRHLRRSGSAGGVLRGSARHGECVWIVSYPLPVILLRALRLTFGRPPRLAGPAFLYGWTRAALRGRGRVEDASFREFSRTEQRERLRIALGQRLRMRRSAERTRDARG